MPQQTKTEALEELARLIRRDIMNGTARLNETWWFDDDTKMQDRIAHVLLDYSDEENTPAPPKEKPITSDFAALLQEFGPPPFVTTSGAALSWLHDQILKTDRAADERTEKAQREANKQIDALNEKCAALVVERDQLRRQMVSFVEDPAQISTPFGLLPINSAGMRRLLDEIVELRDERDHIKAQFAEAFGEQRERAFDKMAKPLDLTEMARVLDECGVAKPGRYDNSTLRIDTDMSDPQPGKLLVVRLDADDVGRAWVPLGEMSDRGRETQNFWPEQRVGFLVETPAVEEQGPWVVYDDPDNLQINPCMGRHGWGKVSEGIGPFDARSDAVAALNGWVMGGYSKAPRIITLAEARAIVGGGQ